MKSPIYITFLLITILLQGCKDPELTENEILTDWIWDAMNEVYLWDSEIDRSLYPTEQEPEPFFYSLLYEKDRFSWIVDDYQALVNSFNNEEVSSGISPYFIRLTGTDDVILVVEYVSEKSPADRAGIKRGDIIININDVPLDVHNYIDLFYGESSKYGFADISSNGLEPNGREVSVKSEIVETNPVKYFDILDYENTSIGYLVYTGFSSGKNNKWVDSLDMAFAELHANNIDKVILDIRYNQGGRVSVAQHIASLLAPAEVPNGDNVLVNFRWNDTYQQYYMQTEGNRSESLVVPFEELPGYNLDLSEVYILTGPRSASACELLIIGLEPYMNVIQIGELTYGKFYGSVSIPDTEEPARHSWALQPIVFKYANSEGFSDFEDGLVPDLEIEDDLFAAKPFGDITDPIVAKALEQITGVSPITKKATFKGPEYDILPNPINDRMKNSVYMDIIDF